MQSNENLEMKEVQLDGESFDAGATATIAVPLSTKMADDTKTTTSTDLEAAVMPPPAQNVILAVAEASGPPSSAASDKDEDEGLSLQVLSARSSTPYTVQAVCCNNANCELGTTDTTTVSLTNEEPNQLVPEVDKNDIAKVDDEVVENEGERHLAEDLDGKKYSRSDLMNIRDAMLTIVRPECLWSTRIKRLNLGKSENGATNGSGNLGNRSKHYRSTNPPNDLMPAFFKRKTAVTNPNTNPITYDNFKYTGTHPFGNYSDGAPSSNHRRIGSGRLNNRDINWDYIPEEDPEKNNLPEFFTTNDTSNGGGKQQQRHTKKYELDDNSNYVKRVINSVVGESSLRSKNSNNSSTEERYSANSSGTSIVNNKSDEPEWFSCGPTSRLDTIELCGFDESDQKQIRLEMENVKSKTDANNNNDGPIPNSGRGGNGHKEKKHLAFQFDDFSIYGGKNNNSGNGNSSSAAGGGGSSSNNSNSRMPSSKFLPLFNAKNNEEKVATKAHQQHQSVNQKSQSLSEFFKRSDMPSVQKEKLSLTEIPSVDEIEAKWRNQQQHNNNNDSKSKTTAENHRSSSENFKKILNQLNQQQNGGASVSSSQAQLPQLANQPALNLFNNENLSNFIKQRNLHQQLLQKQQQQAAFAQLQLNAILSRPDTQMLLLSLARGEISKHGLVVQLANPNLTQADRDAISAVLTFSAAGQYHQQLAINSNHQQQQQFIANQLQNLALLQQMNKSAVAAKRNVGVVQGLPAANGGGSGGGSGGSNMRTYSQEELQSHANYILHNAMMKKKLEEQTNLGVQKIVQLQSSVLNNSFNSNNVRGNDSLAGSKNQQQQHQQQQQHHHHYQHQQRQRKSTNAGNRGNPIARRRSTSSSSSNTTVNAAQMKLAADLEFRQLEQRRNTIATTTVGPDEYLQISQRI